MTVTGTLFVVCAPSGAGKSTLVRLILENDPTLALSISYTTRAARLGEQEGREYHFVTTAQFTAMRVRGEFVEWAKVHGNYYGTSRLLLREQMKNGRDVVLEIDWQGAQQVRQLFPEAVGVFILPPTINELERRLRARGSETEEAISRRLSAAQDEMRHVAEFDYVIINNELQQALGDLLAAIRASRLRLARQQARHPELFSTLFQE